MRCFIAIDLPVKIKDEIENVQRKFRDYASLTKRENLHLTLLFLGEKNDKEISEIKNNLEEICKSKKIIKCKIKEVGVFPNFNYMRIIWVGLKDDNEILNLQNEISNKLEFKNDRSFKSHITIARVKSKRHKKEIQKLIKELETFEGSKFKVKKIKLKKSILTPKGPIYDDLAIFDLGE